VDLPADLPVVIPDLVPDIAQRALARDGNIPLARPEGRALTVGEATVLAIEERKELALRVCPECGKPARMSDGRCVRHSVLRYTQAEVQRRAKRMMAQRTVAYANLHFTAAKVAAVKGDSKPAMEGLVWGGVVEPVAPKTEARGAGGVTVYVGVKLPGLGLD
jgi:hypothetical protein